MYEKVMFFMRISLGLLFFGIAASNDQVPDRFVHETSRVPILADVPLHQAKPIEVILGKSGESVTLIAAEDGGFTLDGEAFASGDEVTAKNGNTYVLTLMDGDWTAIYKPPEPIEITLGTSGEKHLVTKTEDGNYWLLEQLPDNTVTAKNGASYALALVNGTLTAVYQQVEVNIPLGTSGESATLLKAEDGTYSIAGSAVTSGYKLTAGNGNTYALILGDGGWQAVYEPIAVSVQLGTSGETVSLVKAEDGTYWIGASAVTSRYRFRAGNGNRYKLTLTGEVWTAEYEPLSVTVWLGSSGESVTLLKAEDGTYSTGEDLVASGHRVTVGDAAYVLKLVDGAWSAEFVPVYTSIFGTGLAAASEERGGYKVGDARLPLSGAGDVTVDGASYHVWKDEEGTLIGARFDETLEENARMSLGLRNEIDGDGFPVQSLDDPDTIGNEDRTVLTIGENDYAYTTLLDSSVASGVGDNFVATARDNIKVIRDDVEVLVDLRKSGVLTQVEFTNTIGRPQTSPTRWNRVQSEVNSIFGKDADNRRNVKLGYTTSEEKVVGMLDEIIDALSSPEKFVAATTANGGGVFESANYDADRALGVYEAVDSKGTAVLGASGYTRYGAVFRNKAKSANEAMRFDKFGAFVYASIKPTFRTHHILTSGNAVYKGGTRAVSGDGLFYEGDIALEVLFPSRTVNGMITNLESVEGGERWKYAWLPVEAISLPEGSLASDASWSQRSSNGTAYVAHEPSSFSRGVRAAAEFRGQLLGRDDPVASGGQAMGVWSVGAKGNHNDYLVGSFGAVRREDRMGVSLTIVQEQAETTVRPADKAGRDYSGTEFQDGTLLVEGDAILTDPDDKFEIPLEELYANRGDTKNYSSETVVEQVRSEIESLREELTTYISLDVNDDTGANRSLANQNRTRIWDLINKQLAGYDNPDDPTGKYKGEGTLFKDLPFKILDGPDYTGLAEGDGRKWSAGYPVSHTGKALDDDALAAIDRVLRALKNGSRFIRALTEDDGIFNNPSNYENPLSPKDFDASKEPVTARWKVVDPTRDLTALKSRARDPGGETLYVVRDEAEPADIFGADARRLQVLLGETDFTRFGVWRKRRSDTAEAGYTNLDKNPQVSRDGPHAFAYSPLAQTSFWSSREPSFPGPGSSVYTGETVAVQGSKMYEGTIRVSVNWEWVNNASGDDTVGELTAVISDLRDVFLGDRLSYDDGSVSGPIKQLVVGSAAVKVSESDLNKVYFDFTAAAGTGDSIRISLADPSVPPIEYEYVRGVTSTRVNRRGQTISTYKTEFFHPTERDRRIVRNDVQLYGKFLGRTVEGPSAVIGQWMVNSTEIGDRKRIFGSFGAEHDCCF